MFNDFISRADATPDGFGCLERNCGLPGIEFDAIIARLHSVKLAQDIKGRGVPAVVVESGTADLAKENPLRRFDEILANSPKISRVVADHLIGKGLHSFAFCGFENAQWSRTRERAFEQYVTQKGFPCRKYRITSATGCAMRIGRVHDPLVGDAVRFIEDYARRGIWVPEVVSEMGVSRRTLERRFLRAMGRSVLTEINRCKLDRAKRLLQETTLPLCRVATAAGFANPRIFNRTLRRVESFRPSSFRRQLQEGVTANRQAGSASSELGAPRTAPRP